MSDQHASQLVFGSATLVVFSTASIVMGAIFGTSQAVVIGLIIGCAAGLFFAFYIDSQL